MSKEFITPRDEYRKTAETLVERIKALGPRIHTCTNPFDLFKIGLDTSGLEPSFGQASAALAQAKRLLLSEESKVQFGEST